MSVTELSLFYTCPWWCG